MTDPAFDPTCPEPADAPPGSRVRSFRATEELRALVKAYADERGLSVSLAVALLCDDWLSRAEGDTTAPGVMQMSPRQGAGRPLSCWMRDPLWDRLRERAALMETSVARLIASIISAATGMSAERHSAEEEAALEGRA